MTAYECPKVRELEQAVEMFKRKLQRAQAECSRLRGELGESILRETPAKNVVWVRPNSPNSYVLCGKDGDVFKTAAQMKICSIPIFMEAVYRMWELKIKVRVWEPPAEEPVVWVYGVWEHPAGPDLCCKTPHGGNQFSNYTVNEVIKDLLESHLNFMSLSRYPIDWSSTPTFGVRLLTEGELQSLGYLTNPSMFGAFRNGKYILGTVNSDPKTCIRLVILLLTPAKDAGTLADLECAP